MVIFINVFLACGLLYYGDDGDCIAILKPKKGDLSYEKENYYRIRINDVCIQWIGPGP
jgi:hypothetical protein